MSEKEIEWPPPEAIQELMAIDNPVELMQLVTLQVIEFNQVQVKSPVVALRDF